MTLYMYPHMLHLSELQKLNGQSIRLIGIASIR